MNILLVEDQPFIQQSVVDILESKAHKVSAFDSAEQCLAQIHEVEHWSLGILDISLPGINGIELARQLRVLNPTMGIIMLTMHQALDKKLESYKAGADIFLTKPVASEELIATISSLEKRLHMVETNDATPLVFDAVKQKLRREDGVHETLSYKEAKILTALYKQPESQMEYWECLDLVGLSFDSKGRKQLEVTMSRLRQKIVRISQNPNSLIAIRGVGYKITINLNLFE